MCSTSISLKNLLGIITLIVCSFSTINAQKTILVVGGAGYIGSHTSYLLAQKGYNVVILDSFVRNQPWPHNWATVIKGDFGDVKTLDNVFTAYDIDTVMLFAAHIDVGESVNLPQSYYYNNVVKTLTLLNRMRKYNVNKIIFSSTCAVYGNPTTLVVGENHPTNPISPYGKSKLMVEMILEDFARAYNLASVTLRYFNVAGVLSQAGLSTPTTHVIDIILDCIAHHKPFSIFGNNHNTPDGTPIRDYIHVVDIASGHIKAMHFLNKKMITNELKAYRFNLGTGTGFSVQELVTAANATTGKPLSVIITDPRPGDLEKIIADPAAAMEHLDWKPKYSTLEQIFNSIITAQEQAATAVNSLITSITQTGSVS